MGKVDKYVRRTGVTLYMAALTGGTAPTALTGYTEIAHIDGDININDQRGTVTVRSFNDSMDSFDLQYVDGRTGTITHGVHLVPGEPEQLALIDNYDNGTVFAVCLVARDSQAVANKFVRTYEVQLSTLPLNFKLSGVSSGSLTYLIHDKIANPTGT